MIEVTSKKFDLPRMLKVARFPAPTVLLFLAYTLAYTHNYVTGERYSKLLGRSIAETLPVSKKGEQRTRLQQLPKFVRHR